MSRELKPCPFCGSDKHMVLPPTCDKSTPYNPSDRAFPIIRCGGCFTDVPGKDWDSTGNTAIDRWNTRALSAPSIDAEAVERLGTIDKDIARSILSGNSEITRIASGEWSPQSIQLYVSRAALSPDTAARMEAEREEGKFSAIRDAYIRGAEWYRQNDDFGALLHKAASDYADKMTALEREGRE